MKAILKIVFYHFTLLFLLVPSLGVSEESWYLGLGLGSANYESSGLNDNDILTIIYGGYTISKYISLEGAYIDLGSVINRVLPDNIITVSQDTLFIEATGFTLAPVLNYAPSKSFQLSAMAGLAIIDIDKKWTGGTWVNPALERDTGETETEAFVGMRLIYKVSRYLAACISYQYYDLDEIDAESTFGSIQLNF